MLACRTRRLAILQSFWPSLPVARSAQFSTTTKCTISRAQRTGKRFSPPRLDTPEAISLFQSVKASVSAQNSAAYLMTQDEILAFNDNLVKIRQTIRDGNTTELVHVWDRFNKGFERQNELMVGENKMGFVGLKQTFTSKQLQPLSHAVHALYVTVRSGKKALALTDEAKRTLEEICIAAAVIGSSYDGLIGYLGILFQNGELDEVIAVNSRLASYDEVPSEPTEEELGRESELAFYDVSNGGPSLSRSVEYHPDRATVLLFSYAAYAARDDFRGALTTALNTDVRLHGQALKRFADAHLAHKPDLVPRLEDYVHKISTARAIVQPKVFSTRIHKLGEEGRFRLLETIYKDIIAGISGPNPYIGVDPNLNEDGRLVSITENGWATFLVAFLKCRRPDLAEKLWTDLLSFGIQPGLMLWTSLISGHGEAGNITEALKVWDTMQANEIKPDALTYRALISVLFSAQSDLAAMQKFSEFQQKIAKTSPESQVLHVYNTVLHGLLTSSNDEEAKRILGDMKKNGPKPDMVTYNTFMRYHGRRSQFQEMAELVKELESFGLVSDVFTFSTILSAFLKAGRPNAADMIITFMRKHGVEPNVATQSAMIDQQMRQGDEMGIRGALDLLSAMERDPSMKPNEVTYTSILAGIHRNPRMTREEKERIRRDITHRMDKAKISPSRLTYQILMQACFDNPEPEGLQEALNYYHKMVEKRITLTSETWYVLLRGLLEREAWLEADEAVKKMYKVLAEPKPRVTELVKQIRMRGKKGRHTSNRYL